MERKLESLPKWHPYWQSFPNELENRDLNTAVIDYIMSCYHKVEGGFGDFEMEKEAYVSSTAKGLICLGLLKT